MSPPAAADDAVVVVLCTAPCHPDAGKLSAEQLAQQLVAEQLCACVNIVPGVVSWFRWAGRVERAEELLLLLKTTRARWPQLQQRLSDLHPYAVPELLGLDVDRGFGSYLEWVRAAVALAGPAAGPP